MIEVEERRLAGAVRPDDRVNRALAARGSSRPSTATSPPKLFVRFLTSRTSAGRPRRRPVAPVRRPAPPTGRCTASWTAAGAAGAGSVHAPAGTAAEDATPRATTHWMQAADTALETERDDEDDDPEDGVPELRLRG